MTTFASNNHAVLPCAREDIEHCCVFVMSVTPGECLGEFRRDITRGVEEEEDTRISLIRLCMLCVCS